MQVSSAGPNCSAKACAAFDRCVLATVHAELGETTSGVRKVRTPAGADVFHQGTPQAALTILCVGVARLSCCSPNGKTVLLGLCRPGELLAVPSLEAHPHSCRAERDAWVAIVERGALRGLMARGSGLALAIVDTLAGRNAQYVQRIAALANQGAQQRLAGALSHLLQETQHAGSIPHSVEISAKDLGEMAGCSRQTASLWLGKMQKAGVITRESGALTVVRPELL